MSATLTADATAGAGPGKPSDFNAQIKAMSVRDNWTNWYYIGRIWLIIGLTIAACVWAHQSISAAGLSWAWHIPVVLFGLVMIGASQHEFGSVLHEATHFMLFKNRRLNDIAADWLAGFPMYTSIHHYRLYHLAHHQFVNDPVRDPDLATLRHSGHWMDFPVTHIEVLGKILRQLWLPNLFRYTLSRIRGHSFDADHNPYHDASRQGWKGPLYVTLFTWFAAAAILPRFIAIHSWPLAMAFLAATWVLASLYFYMIPDEAFASSRLEPVISHRATAISRVTFITILYGILTVIDLSRDEIYAWRIFELYWALPLFTTFPLFMVLRHWVHHGNADRGRYTNTRVYLVNPFVRYAIFPLGFEYHLPHHMYASVPHYRLKALHDLLERDPEYKEKCVVVEGYFGHGNPVLGRPSAIQLLSEAHAPKGGAPAFMDSSVLDVVEVADRGAIDRAVVESEKDSRG